MALKRISRTTPPISTASSTPFSARAVPMAEMPGVQVMARASVADTVWAGRCIVAKKFAIILSRKKLNQTNAPHRPTASRKTRVTTRRRFMGGPFLSDRSTPICA